jgi:hypothetical protein
MNTDWWGSSSFHWRYQTVYRLELSYEDEVMTTVIYRDDDGDDDDDDDINNNKVIL